MKQIKKTITVFGLTLIADLVEAQEPMNRMQKSNDGIFPILFKFFFLGAVVIGITYIIENRKKKNR